jgi:hypothetical protein
MTRRAGLWGNETHWVSRPSLERTGMTHTLGSANLLCPMPVTLLRALADGKPKFLTNTQAGMFTVTDPELLGPWQTGGQGLGV